MGCLKLHTLERSVSSDTSELKQDYKKPELKIVHSKKRLSSKKSSLEDRKYYGARYYDPVLSNFISVDRFAEKYPSFSSYNYATNNPIRYIEINGDSIILNSIGTIIRNDETDNLVFLQQESGLLPLGELGGEIDASIIYANLLEQNMETADEMWSPFSFRRLVRNRGDWDYKSRENTIYGLANDGETLFNFEGNLMESQDIGNHHFGAVAQEFGFPQEVSLRQAGKAQMAAGTSNPEWQIYEDVYNYVNGSIMHSRLMLPPYGDDPRDQSWIKSGYKYAKRN